MSLAVEYHDPSGLFSLISPDIASRLPLRNLEWRNATRPLRQIKSLHLEFVPDALTSNNLRPTTQQLEASGATSLDIVRSGADNRKNAVKERRHQIPGFQATPYLKIYILRSDDKDIYKTTERQKIRAWIRDNAASTSKGKAENHDAYEWLIIHVVVPDTIASSEPRWRESSAKDSDELKERKQGMKLPGKSTRTVFDKLRADFNDSGKGSVDRVAQIRLTRAQMSPDLLPTPALATTIEETNEERETAWKDIMSKLKTLVLVPFDLRVRQYESDIAEQETRRSMPGFNFCTFFIHKEGLAKALESIGLVEDALVIYDELSLGLETVIRDLARGQAEGTATTFAPYTADFADRIVDMNAVRANGSVSGDAALLGDTGRETFDVDYREKILRSDISVFDFFSYLFARQKVLILRIANAKSATSFTKDGVENILLISEVCWRAMSFVHNVARTLRQDLSALRRAQWEKHTESTLSGPDLESLVCSWTYTVAGRILDETESSSVDQFSDLSKRDNVANGMIHNHNKSDSYLPGGVSAHPQRTTSLAQRKSRVTELQNRTSLQSASDSDLMSPRSSITSDDYLKGGVVASGLLELVTYRAELFMMQRRMLELLAKQRGWLAGWATLKESRKAGLEEVDLNGDIESHAEAEAKSEADTPASKLMTPALAVALESKESFHKTYERLSDKTMRLYVAATQTKTAESIMGDLAILKSQQGDYEYAVTYFQHVLPLYAADGWSLMEDEALKIHANCLKHLDRGEEYVTALLTLLAKTCGRLKAANRPPTKMQLVDDAVDVEGILPDLIAFSRSLGEGTTNPAEQFFADIVVEPEVMHLEDVDGFELRLRFIHLLDDDMELDHLSVHLVSPEDPSMEIWLKNDKPGIVRHGSNDFTLEARVVAFGAYLIDRVIIQAGKLFFVHDFTANMRPQPSSLGILDLESPGTSTSAHKQPWVFLYPSHQAFDVDVLLSKYIHVDKPRYLEIEFKSGWNNIDSLHVRLKPASAGLRLHLADARLEKLDLHEDQESNAGQLSLGPINRDTSALLKVPYSLEQATPEILIRFDADYNTSTGSSSLSRFVKLVTELPLDVDVNDIFHLDYLLSNFTVRSTRGVPLTITQAKLAPSAAYDVEEPPVLTMPMTVFDKQPVKLVYKITRTSPSESTNAKSTALALRMDYCSIDEVILSILRESLATALETSEFAAMSRLLLPLLCERVKRAYSRSELEVAALLDEAKVPSFDEIGWQEVVRTLPIATQADLLEWLASWHSKNGHIKLDQETSLAGAHRSITISVDVPRVDFVHEVSLSILHQETAVSHDPQILALGEPVQVRLTAVTTSNWSKAAILQSKHDDKLDETDADFTLDIHADADSWLVGGQRRTHFVARPGVETMTDVLLIPLRLGLLSLPSVDIQSAAAHHLSDDAQKPKDAAPSASCETHCQSAGQLIQVVRGLRTSGVSISESKTADRPPSRPSASETSKEAG